MTYKRRPGQSHVDLANAKGFEEEVRLALPGYCHVRTESSTELDFFIPSIVVEVKEKRQKLTARWWTGVVPFADEPNLFVMDELTVRKALKHWPYVWFVIRDVPADRVFVASIAEILSADRHRFNRNGKGKWVLDTSRFDTIGDLNELMDYIHEDIATQTWKSSGCVIPAEEV